MDYIYKTRDYQVFNVKQTTDKICEEVNSPELPSNIDEVKEKSSLSSERFDKMCQEINEIVVGLDQEFIPVNAKSEEKDPFKRLSDDALSLNVVKFIQDETIRKKLDEKHHENRRRYTKKPKMLDLPTENPEIAYNEVIITIRFYLPFVHGRDQRSNPKFHQEFLVLSSQFLTELRDKIYCQCNYGPFFDISEDPSAEADLRGVENTNPGFFFIHDTFYNDSRVEENPDYSETIRKWTKKFDFIQEFKTAKMEETKFEDLQLRIGYPCVYQHHAACEHLFCITDIQLATQTDILDKSLYPIINNYALNRTYSCSLCGKREISFIVRDCIMHVENPMKLCEYCFISYHYVDGAKVYPFSAYRHYSIRP